MLEKHDEAREEPGRRQGIGGLSAVIALLLAGVAVIGLVSVLRVDNWGDRGSGLSERFEFTLDGVTAIDPELVAYAETGRVSIPLRSVQAIAAVPEGGFLVAGDGAIQGFQADGSPSLRIAVAGEPTCVAVAGDDHSHPGRIYAGLGTRVAVYAPDGEAVDSWSEGLDEESVLTSLAVFEDSVLAADAGNRVVVRWDSTGRLVTVIGRPDPDRNIGGFVIPSRHFDLAVHRDGILRVANPGARRIEAYTLDGDSLGHWGEASSGIEGFFGCCNPSHFTMLADGRFVTVEKGIPRVKVYSAEGEFQSVVATPHQLSPRLVAGRAVRDDHTLAVFGVAADAAGRVLLLDPGQRSVRIFEPTGVSDDDL
jgi:hypothetical protein